jgi:hypothetical protein
MEQWFSALSTFEKIYWLTAGISSIMFLILIVLTFIGAEVDDLGDVEGDAEIGFQFLSFKNLMGFFTIFGWTGIACLNEGYSKGIIIVISVVCGFIMMTAMASLFYYLTKLDSDGSLKMKNAINSVGEVYLTIGGDRSRTGKVQVNIQGGIRDLDAITDEKEDLKQGEIIIVTNVTDNGILIVDKYTR